MAWWRAESSCRSHRKILKVGGEAAWLWACCGMYSVEHGTDGFVPEEALVTLGVWSDLATLRAKLIAARLLEETEGGVQVHDHLDYNMSAAEALALSRKRAKAGRISASKRSTRTPNTCSTPAQQVLNTPSDRIGVGSESGSPDPDGGCRGEGPQPKAPAPIDRPPHRKVRVTERDGTLREIDPSAEPTLDEAQGRIHGRWMALLQSIRGMVNPAPCPSGAVSAAKVLAGRTEAEQDALLERFVRDDEKRLAAARWPLSWFPARMNGYLDAKVTSPTGLQTPRPSRGQVDAQWAGAKSGPVDMKGVR